MVSNLILVLFVYTSALGLMRESAAKGASSTVTTSVALVVMALVSWVTVRQTGFAPRVFGFTLARWRWVLWDSLVWSLLMCALITLLKLMLIRSVPAYASLQLISVWTARTGWRDTVIMYGLYALLSPVQEFVARGALLGCLEHMLIGRYAPLRATLVSNAVFSISHQHLGLGYAMVVFVPGLFWGWMYHRHQSLLGVSLSHILIGLWGSGALDLASMVVH